ALNAANPNPAGNARLMTSATPPGHGLALTYGPPSAQDPPMSMIERMPRNTRVTHADSPAAPTRNQARSFVPAGRAGSPNILSPWPPTSDRGSPGGSPPPALAPGSSNRDRAPSLPRPRANRRRP